MSHSKLKVFTLVLSGMKKKHTAYKGEIDQFPSKTIHLNVNYLHPGKYVLNIVYKNKVIKKTTFKK